MTQSGCHLNGIVIFSLMYAHCQDVVQCQCCSFSCTWLLHSFAFLRVDALSCLLVQSWRRQQQEVKIQQPSSWDGRKSAPSLQTWKRRSASEQDELYGIYIPPQSWHLTFALGHWFPSWKTLVKKPHNIFYPHLPNAINLLNLITGVYQRTKNSPCLLSYVQFTYYPTLPVQVANI